METPSVVVKVYTGDRQTDIANVIFAFQLFFFTKALTLYDPVLLAGNIHL
jgi:hypothetical protein